VPATAEEPVAPLTIHRKEATMPAPASQAGRSVDVKRALYERIAENLGAVGVRGDDILISLVEMPKENWSFGRGELSYPPAALSITR
jgi:hypothetical protein